MRALTRRLAVALATLVLAASAYAKTGWDDDYAKCLAQAKAGKKLVLMDFTGSDWCSFCLKLEKDIFAQSAFKEYAEKNLVLMEVDFPNLKHLPDKVKKQNDQLMEKYGVETFPTLIVVDGEGNMVKQFEGYQNGGPEAFIAELNKLKK
jgi:thioredoxin-related protein